MKKLNTILAAILLPVATLSAQNEVDALRYSQQYYNGSARFQAMGGAFTALGADFSSIGLNPAGLGVFRSGELSITADLRFSKMESSYLQDKRTDDRFRLNLDQIGWVSSFQTGKESGWAGFNFAIGASRLNNFHNNTYFTGVMPRDNENSSSLLDNFVEYANSGAPYDFLNTQDQLDHYYEGQAWETYLIDTIWDNGYYFYNDFHDPVSGNFVYGQEQRRSIEEIGGVQEYFAAFGTNYANKLYFGASLSLSRVRYEMHVLHSEDDYQDYTYPTGSFDFRETLFTDGTGFTFKAGFIARPLPILRIGASIHTPTFYRLNDEFSTSMNANFDPGYFDPGEENKYSRSDILTYEYKLRTPTRINAGIAVQLPKFATFSLDYEMVNYANAQLDARDFDFAETNSVINQTYRNTHNFRGGAEVRLGGLYLRGGGAYYMSPYEAHEINNDACRWSITSGLGFRSENIFLDFGYAISQVARYYYPYTVSWNTFDNVADDLNLAYLDNRVSNFVVTLGFRF